MQDRRIPTKTMTMTMVAADNNDYEDIITSHNHTLPVHSWGHGMATSTTMLTTKKMEDAANAYPSYVQGYMMYHACWQLLPRRRRQCSSSGIHAHKTIASPTKMTMTMTVVSGTDNNDGRTADDNGNSVADDNDDSMANNDDDNMSVDHWNSRLRLSEPVFWKYRNRKELVVAGSVQLEAKCVKTKTGSGPVVQD
ncbi:hypothetical protein EDB89DRAFT_1904030 [Lactarius sanguifluus]|nr:hypothetical protein EDB89DRAFT_1904030 [Lactarius sanguifluus]